MEAAHGVGRLGLGGGGDFRECGPAHAALALAHAAAGEALDFVDVAEAFGHGLADIPGGDAQGVMAGIDFMRQVNGGQCSKLAGPVVVIGGAAGWYFKIYRPKKQQAIDAAEDYGDDYDDTPPWEDEDETESEDEA